MSCACSSLFALELTEIKVLAAIMDPRVSHVYSQLMNSMSNIALTV